MKFVIALFLGFIATTSFAFQSIAVLPFANESQNQQLYWLGEGFAESLSEEMLLNDAYVIQRVERKNAYDDLRLPYIGGLSRATMLKIGQKLSADYIVFGSYNLHDTELSVEAHVIQLSSAKLSAPIQASGKLESLYEIQTSLQQKLLEYFQAKPVTVPESQTQAKGVPLYAYELYIKGMLESNDNERARFFQKALDANPGYDQASYRLGRALAHLQKYKESTEALQKATFSGILQTKVDFQIGLNAFEQKDYDAAYQKWLDLSNKFATAEVYNNIGIALLKKGDLQNCGWYLSKAAELDPNNPDYRFNLAASYVLRAYDKNAVMQYRESIRYRPSDYQALYLLGKLLERMTDPSSKIILQQFQDALPADQKGKFPEQYSTVSQLVRSAPEVLSKEEKQYMLIAAQKEMTARMDYAKTYAANARKDLEDQAPDKAFIELRKGVGLSPLDWYMHFLLGWAYNQQKNHDQAIAELQFAVWCQDNFESHLLMADIYRGVEKYADAKAQVQRALAVEPGNKRAMDLWNKISDKN